MSSHVQHQVVFVLRFLVADRTLELRLHTTLEPYVPVQRVWSAVRVAATRTEVLCGIAAYRRVTSTVDYC